MLISISLSYSWAEFQMLLVLVITEFVSLAFSAHFHVFTFAVGNK